MAIELSCAVLPCTRAARKRGWCDSHYQQWRKAGSVRPLAYDRMAPKVCTVCGARDWPDNGRRSKCSPRCQQLASRERLGELVRSELACAGCGVTVDVAARAGTRKFRSDIRYCADCRLLKSIRLVGRGILTAADVRAMGTTCAICEESIDFTTRVKADRPSVDHIEPIARGGSDDRSNLQLTHFRCNQRKQTRSMTAVVAERGGTPWR